MERRLFNPEMDELVEGLNLRLEPGEGEAGEGATAEAAPTVATPPTSPRGRPVLDDPALREVRWEEPLGAVLEEMARRGASDLVPTRDGRRVPALEILVATHAVRNLIRKGAVEQLANEFLTGRARGMRSMEESLAALVRAGVVDPDDARLRAPRLDELERRLAE